MAEHSPHITMQCFAVLYSLLFWLYTFVMLNCLIVFCVGVCVCVGGIRMIQKADFHFMHLL